MVLAQNYASKRLWAPRGEHVLCGAALVLASALHLWAWGGFLYQVPVAFGQDGYYYAIQIRSIMERGVVQYPTSALVPLYLLAGISTLGPDPVQATKAGAVLFLGLWLLVTYLLVTTVTTRPGYGLLACAVICSSRLHDAFVIEFVGNLFGIVSTLSAMLLSVQALRSGFTRRRLGLLAALAVVCVFSHKSSAFLVLLFGAILGTLFWRDELRDWLCRFWFEIGCLAASCTWLYYASFHDRLFVHLPWLRQAFGPPAWPFGPHSFGPESAGLASTVAFVAVLLVAQRRRASGSRTVDRLFLSTLMVMAVVVCLNPFARYSSAGVGAMERLGMWSLAFLSILLPACLSLAVGHGRRLTGPVLALCLITVVAGRAERGLVGSSERFLRDRLDLWSVLADLLPGPGRRVIIADHGMEFLVTYGTGAPAVSRREAIEARSDAVAWLLDVGGLRTDVTNGLGGRRVGRWALVPEASMERWLATASGQELGALIRRNRHLLRTLARWRNQSPRLITSV